MPPSVRQIILEVAAKHHLRPRRLLERNRVKLVAAARMELYARLRAEIVIDHKPASYPQIGLWTNRNHSTVLHGARRHASGFECGEAA